MADDPVLLTRDSARWIGTSIRQLQQRLGVQNPARRWPKEGGGGGTPLARLKIASIHDNYLMCKRWEGEAWGTEDVYVAKPFLLRHELANYSGLTSFDTTGPQDADIVYGVLTLHWTVSPPYAVDEEIRAWSMVTGVMTDPVGDPPEAVECVLEDANNGAHKWATVAVV